MNDNKKVAVNTIILYVKLIINTVVSFITARLVLSALGASDYGLYNVVGGIVTMLNLLGTSMIATSYRYMAVEIGRKESGNPNGVYNTIFVIHLALAILLIVLGESVGVFYVNNYLNVEAGKIPDALFVLHLSLLTCAFAVITVPMNGLIVAREKFLFSTIVESASAILKLLFVIALFYMSGDKIRIYAIMMAIVQLIVPVSYQIYCRIKDAAIVKWNFNRNIKDYKQISTFAFWMLIGAGAVMGKIQGAAIIINLFFGTVLNAAFGIASQVSHAIGHFTSTLRQAAIPQIMKNQEKNEGRSLSLVYAISRYSYLSMNILAIPVFLSIDELLTIWLGDYPQYTDIYVRFMLISGMILNLGSGFDASIQATGKVRKNQIGYCLINLSLLPIIFILYKLGFPPYVNVITMVVLAVVTVIFQSHILSELTSFSRKEYIRRTIVPSLTSTVVAFVPLFFLHLFMPRSIVMTIVFCLIGAVWTMVSIYLCGVTKNEKMLFNNYVRNKIISKIKHA